MKGKNDTMAKRILENGEIKDKKKINKSRIAGMTLIALVVTIIVIIILATVGITIGLGSGGIIEKAQVSKDIVKLSEYESSIKMVTASEYTKKMSNEKTGKLKKLVKDTLKTEEKWVKDVEDVKDDENKIRVITVENYIIVAQIWDDGDLDIINSGKDNEEPYPVISIDQEVVDENTIKLKVIATVTTTDKTKGIDTVTFINTGDVVNNYRAGDELTFNVTKSGKYTFEAVTNMGKATKQSVMVKIESAEADIQIASEPTTSRNTLKTGKLNGVDAGPIEVNIDYGYTKLLKQYKLGEDGTWTNVDSQNVKLKVTDNMTVYARYFDGESKEVKLTSYDVANVDNIAPNAFGITATSTSNSITVNASTIDTANKGAKVGISGVKEYLYRIFRNESWGEWQSSKQFTDLPEGEYKVQAKAIDKAGNETISSNVVTLECKLQRAEVTFDNNDGSDKKQTVSKVVGTELGELPTVSREGYEFAGWYTDKTSGTRVTENTVVPETDVTYYARWTARNDTKYTVIHQQMNLDGTTYTTVDTEELKGKTDSKVTPDVKSYEGFTAPEKQEVTIKADGSTSVTYKYTRNKYTLTYNPNGGSVSPTSIKADYDEEITLPTPTRKYTITYNTNGGSSVTNSTVDYTFNGWYTKASEGDKRTYTKMPAYNETLYAQWASSGIALPTTNKAGYVLAGWYTDSALTSEVTLSDGKYIPTANITLYAKWEEVVITLNPMSFTYDGTEKKPETTVKVGSKTLEKDKDYTVEYKNNINVGTATVTITGKGSYEGVTATTTFKINEKRITIPAGKTLTYNGEEQTGVDSKDEYKFSGTIKATNAGTYSATATLTDTANTKWSDETTEAKTISWKINAKKLSGNVTVSDVEDKTYTGSAITPEVEVKDTARNTVLTKNTDYTISYKNNVNAGTATITITGKGNYTGTVEKTFKINGDENPIKVTNKTVYTGSTVDLSTLVSDAQGDVTFSIKTNGTTTASTLSGSKLTAGAMSATDDKDQTVVITAKAAGNGNYNPGNKEITITVQKYTATLTWNTTTPNSVEYGTTGKTATATVKVTGGTAGKLTYTSGTINVLEIGTNTGALTTKKVGSSDITAKMTRTSTVKEASIKKTITVTAKKIEIPTGKTLTYNGSEQIGVDSKAGYNLSGTVKATIAGTYNATASLADTNNTQWSDGSTSAKNISWKINAKNLSGNVIISNIADQTYTGSEITPQPTVTDTARNKTLTYNSDYTLRYNDNTTVGTATITITGKGNYTGTVEKTFKIVKAIVAVPTQNGTLTYSGYEQSPKWNNYNTNLMTIGGMTTGIDAGSYNATFALKDKANYQWNGGATGDKTVEWKIVQRENTIAVAGKTLTYNGKGQELVTVANAKGTVYYSIGTELTSNNYTTAGSTEIPKATNANIEGYKVYYYCEGNINNKAKSGSVISKINKAINPIGITNKTVYAGSVTDLTTAVVGAQGNVTFEMVSSGTTTASTLSGSKLTAGTMSTTDDNAQTVVVKATAEGNNNYNAGSKNITITVQKYSVSLSWTSSTPSNIIYGTIGRTATVTATVAGGTKGKITYTSGSTDVLEIDASTGALTTKKVGSSEITASIERTSTVKPATTKKKIAVVQNTNPITATAKTLTYNGKDQELISVSNAQGDVYYSVGTVLSSSNYKTAGSTTIPTRKDANVNGYVVYYYCEGNTNYSAKAGSVTTKINKASLTITADNKTMTYGGTAPTYTYTGSGYVNSETASVLGGTASYTVKNSSGTTVTVSSTTAAGTYTITPSGLSSSNYNITYKTGTLTIDRAKTAIASAANKTYTGSEQTGVTGSGVTWTGTTKATDAGTYTATATPDGNHAWSDGTTGAKSVSWTMSPKTLTVPASLAAKTYNGASQASGISAPAGSSIVTASSTTSATNVGTYNIVIQLSSTKNYKWSDNTTTNKTITWKINAYNLSNATIASVSAQTYTGKAITPTPAVTVPIPSGKTTTLVSGTNYTYGYSANTNAGTATITVTGKGNYTGTKNITFTISRAKTATASAANKTYTGSEQIGVTGSGVTWTGTTKATDAGTYTATATPDGNHAWSDGTTGAKSVSWTMSPKTLTVPASLAAKTYNGASQASGISAPAGSSIVTASSTTSATNVGTYNVVIQLSSTKNYKWSDNTTANKTITWKINPKNLSGNVTVADVAAIKYTGNPITPAPTVKDNARNVNLTPNTDYTISHSNNTNVGTATITFTGKGNYTGTTTKTFTISKATNPITVTAKTLKYTGSAQSLVTTANAQGTVYYSVGTALTSSNYSTAGSTTIPTRTNVSTSGYVVYYYCIGNSNYNAKSGNVTVNIAKIPAKNPTLTDVTVPYDTKAHAISVSGGSGGTIYYRISSDNSTWENWTTTKPTRTSVGTTYVQAYVKGDSNHSNSSATASKKITIQTSYWKNKTKGTYYATTASAISAAAANDTLELQRNFTDAGTVSINKTLYINLNSYTWTKTTSTITITSAGTVYLGADKGKITTSGAFNLITNAGKFYLGGPNTFSGSLTRTNASSDYSVVYNTGTYSQASTSTVITSTGIGIYNNGGDVSIQTGTIDANYHAIKNHAGTLEINGGGVTITGNKGTDVTWSAVCNDEGATMTLKSGTITGSNHQGISNYGTCTISGGTVKPGKASNAITNQSTGKVTITGGTISTTTGYAISSSSTQTAAVSVTGGTITSSTTNGTILNGASGTITLSGGTITNTNGTTGTTHSVVKNTSTGKILISGATVQKQGNGAIVYNTSTGTIQMNSGTIKAVTNAGYGIYSTSTGAVTMNGGTISSVNNGIDAKGNITVTGGTIRAIVGAIYQRGAGKTVTIGTSASTSASSPEIYGSVQGIYATDTNGVTIYCYSGKIGVSGSTGNPVINNNGTTIIGSQVANKTKSPTIVFCSNNSDSNTPVVDTGTLVYYSGTLGSVGGRYYKVSSVSHIPLMFKAPNFVNETSGEGAVTYYGGTNNKNMSVVINGQTYYMGPYNSRTYTK